MFEAVVRDGVGRVVDPRDVPPARLSSFAASQLDRYAAVLTANVDALEADNQLELGAELGSCISTLEWTKCRVAASLAIRDGSDPATCHQPTTPSLGRPVTRRLGGAGTPVVSEFLIPELALAFGCSEREAVSYVAVGLDLRFRLRCTNCDFGGGRLNYAAAKVISEATRHLSVEAAEALDPILAEAAMTRTPARLRILARRQAAAADPDGFTRRQVDAFANRGASMFPLGDGMGAFSLTTSLTAAAVIDDTVDAWARKLRAAHPQLPLDAHRADAATRLLLGQHPLTGASLHPVPASTASTTPAADVAPDAPTREQLTALPVLTELRVTMSTDTLLGIDDATCTLDGYGPITAGQARALALQSASVKLRRVFTDPADDAIMFLDANTYRFTRDQIACITTLHPYSTFPGATTPDSRCDIDHLHEYRAGRGGPDPPGQTLVANAEPLGRRHHRLKTHGGWRVDSHPDDAHTFTWISPHGRTYTVNDTHSA